MCEKRNQYYNFNVSRTCYLDTHFEIFLPILKVGDLQLLYYTIGICSHRFTVFNDF